MNGFTLIELLTVIAIIAILAAVAMPGITAVQKTAKMNAATQHARSIGTAMRVFATDNGGDFPAGENIYGEDIGDSNTAFRDLIPDYCDNERIFAVPGSKWGRKADTRISPESEILKAGENHFSYIAGLSTTSPSTWPIIVDGTNGDKKYTSDQASKGSVWGGSRAIVVRIDMSAEAVRLRGTGDTRYIPRLDEPDKNALDLADYMGSDVELLDPAS